jgi:type IV secretory pathway VirB10-like protein
MDVRNVKDVVRLRKGVFVTVLSVVLIALGIALVTAFQKKEAAKENEFQETHVTGAQKITDSIASLPDDYSEIPLYVEEDSEDEVEYAPEKPHQSMNTYKNIPHHSAHPTQQIPQNQGPDEKDAARKSQLAFKINNRNLPGQNQTPSVKRHTPAPDALTASLNQMAQGQTPLIESDANQNMQLEKRDFKKKKEDDDAVYVNHLLQNPLSPYQVMAGTVIPGVMITGINSELPGQIIGQVRENVYDTVTGNYLLIPQGTKVIGRYDSVIAYGQERVLIVWNRLIMPNGSSLLLDTMPGTDPGGYSGLKDKVNNHYLKLASGVILSTILSVGASVSRGTPGYNDDDNGYDITNKFAENAGQSINQAGQKIVGKILNIQPTLEIRPGLKFNVMVNKDIVLRPYSG